MQEKSSKRCENLMNFHVERCLLFTKILHDFLQKIRGSNCNIKTLTDIQISKCHQALGSF